VKPLYEASGAQDHPIFAFPSPQDPGYKLMLTWISEGARRRTEAPPVSFTREVLPLLAAPAASGGAGCVSCHGVEPAAAGFSVSGPAAAVHAELVTEPANDPSVTGELRRVNLMQPERSLLLTMPTSGSQVRHPAKLFTGTADPRYALLYRWIQQGATID
jgi:hypothetical protein